MKDIRGFTYIEVIIVLLCLSILTGIVIVKNPFGMSDYGGIASDQLIADIRLVQLKAISTKKPQNIYFNVNESTYDLRENTTVIEQKRLPNKAFKVKDSFTVIIRTANFGSSNVLTFNTLGEPLFGGTVTLGNTTDTYATITVSPITGRASAS